MSKRAMISKIMTQHVINCSDSETNYLPARKDVLIGLR